MDIQTRAQGLPPPACFDAECGVHTGPEQVCGRRGPYAQGFVYVIGANAPLGDVPPPYRCPRCDRAEIPRRLLDADSLKQRFAWAAEHFTVATPARPSGLFPCECPAWPPCVVTGETRVVMTTVGDTCFNSDHDWIRIAGRAACRACGAATKLALLEKHSPRWTHEAPWYAAFRAARREGVVL